MRFSGTKHCAIIVVPSGIPQRVSAKRRGKEVDHAGIRKPQVVQIRILIVSVCPVETTMTSAQTTCSSLVDRVTLRFSDTRSPTGNESRNRKAGNRHSAETLTDKTCSACR